MAHYAPVDRVEQQKVEKAMASPFKSYLTEYCRANNIVKTEDDIIKLLVRYDGYEEDVYQAMEEVYGTRPQWPPGMPPMDARLSPHRGMRGGGGGGGGGVYGGGSGGGGGGGGYGGGNDAVYTSRLRQGGMERRMSPEGHPMLREEFLQRYGNLDAWEECPPETAVPRDAQGRVRPRKTAVNLARHRHSPFEPPFCCSRCPRCGAMLELLLDPSVMSYHEVRRQLSEALLTIDRLERAEKPGPPPAAAAPAPATSSAELQRLQWIIRELTEKERIQKARANKFQMKVMELTMENQRLQENPLKSRLDTREQEAADLKTKLSVASESLSKRNLEYDQLRRHLETVEANLLQAETYKRGEQEQRAQAQLKRAIAAIQQQDTPSSDASPALQHYLAKQKQPIALNPASRSTQDTPRSTAAQPVRHSHGVKEAISSSVGVAIDPSKDPMSSEPKPPGRHGSTPVASPASSAPAYAKAKQLADNHLAALLDKANRQPKRESITWSRDNRR